MIGICLQYLRALQYPQISCFMPYKRVLRLIHRLYAATAKRFSRFKDELWLFLQQSRYGSAHLVA